MHNRQKYGEKSWLDKVLESMDVAGDAIIDFAKKRSVPQYLTAFGGLLALIGAMSPWTYATYHSVKIQGHAGFTWLPGKIIAVSGLVIILLALFIRAKPGKPNSLASSALSLIDSLMVCGFWSFLFPVCCVDYYPGYGSVAGFGYFLSLFAPVLTFIFGLIPNPKQTDPTKRAVAKSVGVPWFIAILAYGAVVTTVTLLGYGSDFRRIFRNPFFPVVMWMAMLVVPGGILLARKHQTAGWILVGIAILVTAFLVWLRFTIGNAVIP